MYACGLFTALGETPQAGVAAMTDAAVPVDVAAGIPSGMLLGSPEPNPFRQVTTIRFAIPRGGPVRLDVLDLSGRLVRTLIDDVRDAGRHWVEWSGRDRRGHLVGSGMYFLRLESAARVSTRKIVFAP